MDMLDTLSGINLGDVLVGREGSSQVTCKVERELELAEVMSLEAGQLEREVAESDDLSKLRARHHMVARLLAQGYPEGLVATLTQYQPYTISTLKNNPAMQELISHYRAPVDAAHALAAEKLRTVSQGALDELAERLHTNPEGIEDATLVSMAKLGADRTGNGPSSTVNVNAKVLHMTVDELKERRAQVEANERNLIQPARPALEAPRNPDL